MFGQVTDPEADAVGYAVKDMPQEKAPREAVAVDVMIEVEEHVATSAVVACTKVLITVVVIPGTVRVEVCHTVLVTVTAVAETTPVVEAVLVSVRVGVRTRHEHAELIAAAALAGRGHALDSHPGIAGERSSNTACEGSSISARRL